jgi:hypothetical protein
MICLLLLAVASLLFNAGIVRGADGAIGRNVLLPPSQNNPRNSEGAFIRLKDGSILLVYTHFTSGSADHAQAHLASRLSTDGGITWSASDTNVSTPAGRQNVMSVSLLRLRDGRIAIFYLIKNSWTDCRLYMQTSSDEARSWDKPLLCIPNPGYYVVNNDRVIQLESGRLIVPAAVHITADGKHTIRAASTCYLSDDAGQTWRRARTTLSPPDESKAGLQEPGVVERADGSLLMFMRTDLGFQYQSVSTDAGETWSPARPSSLASPLSPASIKRIPGRDALLAVWNDHRNVEPGLRDKRTPLTAAVSTDGGTTWSGPLVIESDPDGWYCYTAIEFVGDRVLLAHCAGRTRQNGLNTLQITWFPLSLLLP